MAIASHHPATTARLRPVSAVSAISVLVFLGITATGGGIGFFFDVGMRDESWLEQIPLISNWAVPGLVLGIGFGLGSLLTAYGVLRRPDWGWLAWVESATGHHWAWVATLALGIGMLVWIGLQLVWLDPHLLHWIYGTVGVVLVSIATRRSYRAYLSPSR